MTFILFLDTETCGFPNDRLPDDHPGQPPLVQLGAVLADADNGAEFGTVELIVRPNGQYRIPASATACHGITTELAEAVGVPLSLVVPAYVHLRARASLIVGFNLKFDLTIMRQAIARNGKPVTLPGPEEYFDVAEASAEFVGLPPTDRMREFGHGNKNKTPKLMEAYVQLFGEEFPGAHGALSDARAAARIYFEMIRIKNQGRDAS